MLGLSLTDIGALVGSLTGITGVILGFWNLNLRRKERVIRGKLEVFSLDAESSHSIGYKVINIGHVPFYLEKIGIRQTDNKVKLYHERSGNLVRFYESSDKLPHLLNPGDSWEGIIVDYNIYRMNIMGFEVTDKAGNIFRCNKRDAEKVINDLRGVKIPGVKIPFDADNANTLKLKIMNNYCCHTRRDI